MPNKKSQVTPDITQAILDNVVDGIITIDRKGIIRSFNKAAEAMFGYTPDEVLGQNVNILMEGTNHKLHNQYINNYLKTGDAQIIGIGRLVKARKKSGEEMDIELAIGMVEKDSEKFFVGITRDVSIRELIRQQSDNTNKLLNSITEAQSQFIQDVKPAIVFETLLSKILEVTESDIGFIGQVFSDGNDKPVMKTLAISDISWDEDSRELYRKSAAGKLMFHNTENLFGHTMLTGETVISNDAKKDNRSGDTPEGHMNIKTYLGVPIKQGNIMVGILGLANRRFGYDQSIVSFLSPILTTCGSIIQALNQTEQRKKAQRDLLMANQKLEVTVNEMEERTREISIVRDLDDYLQVCRSYSEAYAVTRNMLKQLFPQSMGFIYANNRSNDGLLMMEYWGSQDNIDPILDHDDCIAARRGRTHYNLLDQAALLCLHVKNPSKPSVCIPIQAQGDSFGILSISGFNTQHDEVVNQNRIELCEGVARQLAMALANLKLRDSLKEQSVKDPLTGLYNRRYIEASIERELYRAERNKDPIAVLMFDVDHFKQINDTFGHDIGDLMLKEVSEILNKHCRKSDIPGRYGGEEFILVMPGLDRSLSIKRVESILQAVREITVEKHGTRIEQQTISCGIALYPEDGKTSNELFSAADKALYKSKSDGRDRYTEARSLDKALRKAS
ncbi:MAG: diguanylate cyclase [Gammaproteobacteria bacterium]|nr:diguanylate cyclase [Gammaproteobacteria bacterium]